MAPSPWAALGRRHVDLEGEYAEPLAGVIISVILAMLSLAIISSFLSELVHGRGCYLLRLWLADTRPAQRFLAVKIWARLPFVQWRTSIFFGGERAQ
jgi:hypothetical protein